MALSRLWNNMQASTNNLITLKFGFSDLIYHYIYVEVGQKSKCQKTLTSSGIRKAVTKTNNINCINSIFSVIFKVHVLKCK